MSGAAPPPEPLSKRRGAAASSGSDPPAVDGAADGPVVVDAAAAADAADAPQAPPFALASLYGGGGGSGDDDGYDGYDYDDDDNGAAFGDAFTAVLARVPELMATAARWAAEGSDAKAAAHALDALCARPLLPDDVLGGERWQDLCAALPVCLLGRQGGEEKEEEPTAAAAARLLRFLSPALLAGSGGCTDALATVLTPLLDHMARMGSRRLFSVRRHTDAASVEPSSAASAAQAPDAITLQFALVGLHRLGRQWHLLEPGLGPPLARAVCALLAAAASSSSPPPPRATAAEALLAWEADAAWWHRLCAVTGASLDLASESASLLSALGEWAVGKKGASFGGSAADAVAAHALAGALGAPAVRRAVAAEGPLWDGLLLIAASEQQDCQLADTARKAARATLARLAGGGAPEPQAPAAVLRAAAATVAVAGDGGGG